MNIWILNHHALTPDMSGGTRHYDFAKELIGRGHSVVIVASSFHYSKYKEMRDYKDKQYLVEDMDGVEFVWIKTPPYYGNGIDRVKNMLYYTYKVLKIIPKLNINKPDVIIGSSVHLFAVYAAYRLSKRYQVPFVMEIRDLWPQTLIDMGMSKYHPFIMLLSQLEKFLYKKADKIITLLPKAKLYIQDLGINQEKIVWISNGTDFADDLVDSSNSFLSNEKFNVLYAGTVGLANDLDLLIDVVDILKEDSLIFFTILGDGPLKMKLLQRVEGLKLQNIQFLPSVPKGEILSYLNSADLLYVGLKNLPLYRFGMSMNKVFDYMAARKPILFVSTIEDSVVEKAGCTTVIKSRDPIIIAKTIKEYSKISQKKRDEIGDKGYRYLQENFTIPVLTDKLEKTLIEVTRI